MSAKQVLYVGKPDAQLIQLLDDGVQTTQAETILEAINIMEQAPPDLVLAHERVDGTESLDLARRVLKRWPDHSIPMVFLAAEGSELEPFVYDSRGSGFRVRYLNADGEVCTHFVTDEGGRRTTTTRRLDPTRLKQELDALLGGVAQDVGESQAELDPAALWDIGFNNLVERGDTKYQAQTEVVAVEPLTVTTSVFHQGRALHFQEHSIEASGGDLANIAAEVETLHLEVMAMLNRGEIG